jgi:uncharacterized protein YnzC (UPF0291/DUF896 family)
MDNKETITSGYYYSSNEGRKDHMHEEAIDQLIARINELSRKQRSEGLTEWEKAEQEALRQEYLAYIRKQVVQTLEQAGIPKKTIQ